MSDYTGRQGEIPPPYYHDWGPETAVEKEARYWRDKQAMATGARPSIWHEFTNPASPHFDPPDFALFRATAPTAAIPAPPSIWNRPAGDRVHAGLGYSTILPDFDFETYSEAGYVWDAEAGKWRAPPGASQGKKGLPVVGAQVYAEHPSTEVLSVYYDLKDGRGRRRWLPSDPLPPLDLLAHVTGGGLLAAWNSGFEYRIWNLVCRRRYGWPALPLAQLRCDAAKARSFALPGALAKAGNVLDIVYKKDPAGDALLKKFSMPHDLTKKRRAPRITVLDEPDEAARLYAYNERDIVAEAEAAARIPDLEGVELEYWLMDQEINTRGVQVDREGVHNCIAIVNQALEQYNRELHALTGGTVARASELAKLQGWLGANGVHTDSLDAEHIEAMLAADDRACAAFGVPGAATPMRDDCRRAIEIRAQIGSAAVKKVFSMANMMGAAGRLYDLFTFYGAHTGRTTGNDAQPTNLPKSGPDVCQCASCSRFYGAQKVAGRFKHSTCPWCRRPELPTRKVHEWGWRAAEDALAVIATRDLATVEHYFGEGMPTVSGCLRALFISAPGYDLIASDYSAIEAVVLAMLAGCQWRIEVFRTHGKIYEASGAKVAKLSLQEVLDHKKIHGTHHPIRPKGKVMELACGYGGWIGAMINFGADEYMTEEEMKTAVLAWRAESPEVPEMWGGQWRRVPGGGWRKENFGVEGAFLEAILNPGVQQECRGFKFLVRADVLYLTLLSGRSMKYHRPRVAQVEQWGRVQYEISYEGWNTTPKNGPPGWIRKTTYGGRLTENIVQATARDIQWHGMLNLKRAGYPVVLHVYDEDAVEVPEGFGSIEEVERIMASMPAWAHDWPIKAAGGWRGRRYRKD